MYRAPVGDIAYTLKNIAGMDQAIRTGWFEDLGEDLVDAVLHEAARFASEEIAPLNQAGDRIGARLADAKVTMPDGWKETYRAWIDGGWNAISAPNEYGGQGLPVMLSVAVSEMWNSACMAFGLGPLLTIGAIEALYRHGSSELKEKYLAKLVAGEWTGTMNLTEPQAGSDLNALKARAEPGPDGTYRIFGQKIFITYGEHDLTENICHLVLARLPDAPPGTRGISLFLVPKFLVADDGTIGERNDVFCQSLEEKLGIHASPTCVMIFGDGFGGRTPGAVGYLIGEENKGLHCMFTMMNNARLNVGIQGVAIGEAAFQMALEYARERRQGRAPGWDGKAMSPIVEHPDVARMLLSMKSQIQSARAICYACANAIDMAQRAAGEERGIWAERAGLLTPVAKAYSTDIGCEVASLGVQVHGGMGYIEETGAAQFMRDARINPIYEGTNGIQAVDLVTRKLPMSGGASVTAYIAELREIADEARMSNELGRAANRLGEALDAFEQATQWLLTALRDGKPAEALAGATPYLRLFGTAAGGAYLLKGALADSKRTALACFFAENFLPGCGALQQTVSTGASSLLTAGSEIDD